ncbi:hypothetical protein [Aliihoeflea sp. 40Bstr573]|uniref:hypothetical protein n=1 Tax=Aliihoeflea sp. 40Bstr573 TaxID=2696467 RepID=UPI0020960E5C|nr:hypothetical protein [Aliihoeflea sp. 40Bstr573]MCO6388339.1 hypothetical protein [Aliihoeflea sp. 40Bstr573]
MGQARQFGLMPPPSRPALAARRQQEPEAVFLAWLMWLPADADQQQAAAREVSRIDASGAKGEGPEKLRALFAGLAAG